jgi:predicted transcriptional regulator
MPDLTIENRMLLRKTLTTVGAMVGACILFVGTLTLLVSAVVGGALAGSASDQASVNASPNTRPALPTAKTSSPAPPNSSR